MVSTAKNTFYLLAAYIYQKLIALFYFIFLARYLGADSFGKYTFAISFATLFSVLIDFGLFPVLTREIARDKEKTKIYFGNVLTFNLLAGTFVLFLICLLINLLNYPSITKILVFLSSLVALSDALALGVYQVFRGHLNLRFESIGIIIHKTVMLIVGLVLIFSGAKLIWMILPLMFASLFYLFNAVIFLRRKLGLWPIPRFDRSILRFLLGLAWPFFIAAAFGKLFATSDTILLSHLGNDTYVGWYSAAQKLATAFLLLVAGSLSTALYPAFSYYFVRSKDVLNKLFHQGVFYLMLITIPLVFGLLVLSRPIILFIYGGDYLPAAPVLILFSLSIPFMFLDYIISGFLNACEKQKVNTFIHGIGAVIFIVLILIFIPNFYHLGVAVAVVVSFLFLFIMEAYWAGKIIQIDVKYFLKKISAIFLAGLAMAVVLLLIKNSLHLIACVIIGILIYFIASCVLGLVKKQDIIFLKSIIRLKK